MCAGGPARRFGLSWPWTIHALAALQQGPAMIECLTALAIAWLTMTGAATPEVALGRGRAVSLDRLPPQACE
jgi:hypothetical protein